MENEISDFINENKFSRNNLKNKINFIFEEIEQKLEEEEIISKENQHKLLDLIESTCNEIL